MDSPAFVERSGPGGPHEISDLGKAGVRATSSEAVAVSGTFPAATRLTPNGPETPRGLQGAPLQRAVSAEVSESYFSPGDAESPTTSPVRDAERYERLRGEAARQGMKMLEEERERNREMNELLKVLRVQDTCYIVAMFISKSSLPCLLVFASYRIFVFKRRRKRATHISDTH